MRNKIAAILIGLAAAGFYISAPIGLASALYYWGGANLPINVALWSALKFTGGWIIGCGVAFAVGFLAISPDNKTVKRTALTLH